MAVASLTRGDYLMLSQERQRELIKNCQHSVPDMLARERQFIPLFNPGDGLVWCADCGVWIPFENGPRHPSTVTGSQK